MSKQEKTKNQGTLRALSAHEVGYDREGLETSSVAVAQWIRSLLQNWRQGTLATKGRADVSLSNKKPWKQKGTGRARAGTARSPIWRGGGVTFGPQKRSRKLTVTKQMKRQVLRHLAHQFLSQDKVCIFDWQIEGDKPSTAQASHLLKNADFFTKKVILFVPMDDFLTYASFANLSQVKVLFFDQANAFDLINADRWMVLNKDVESFKEMVSRWI
jgi:large subunit ribosomal protein L4